MGAIANTIAIVVIVCVGYLIIKKVYPTAVLMIAGLVLLCCAVLLDVEPGLALKKGTGSEFFDIFKIIQDVFSTTLGGLGLNIMCMGGFAKYMDKLEAGRSLYDVVSAPLKYVKNPYMLAMAGFIVDQLLGMAIPSASGLGLLMMVTMYPVFIRAGVPRMTAVCVIAAGRFFDLGPGSASCNMACKTAGIEWADYFLNWQMGIYWALLPTMLVTMYFTQKYWDKREGLDPDFEALREKFRQEEADDTNKAPKIYALLTVLPLFLLLTFNPIVTEYFGLPTIKLGIPAAVIITIFVSMIFEYIRKREFAEVMASMKVFFEGMGKYFAVVVTLIVAGQVFGKGLTAIGAVNALIAGAESMGLGVMSLIIVMGVIIGIIAFLMGSGNAPFYSFASIAPAIAEKFGVHAADVLLPLQTMTGFGRTMSPVTGGIVAVAGMAGVSPFRVVKRNMVPLLCCCVVNFLVVYLFILP